jgi:hypothetical protein
MSLLLSVFLVLLGAVDGTLNESTQTPDEVMQLEQRFTTALLKRDDIEFNELLAEDLVHIGFEGQIAGKAEYMAFFKQGAWRYKKYEPANVAVKLIGNAAVVTGRIERTIVVNDRKTTGAFAFTHVWSKLGERWRLTSSQVTTVPNSSAAPR